MHIKGHQNMVGVATMYLLGTTHIFYYHVANLLYYMSIKCDL